MRTTAEAAVPSLLWNVTLYTVVSQMAYKVVGALIGVSKLKPEVASAESPQNENVCPAHVGLLAGAVAVYSAVTSWEGMSMSLSLLQSKDTV